MIGWNYDKTQSKYPNKGLFYKLSISFLFDWLKVTPSIISLVSSILSQFVAFKIIKWYNFLPIRQQIYRQSLKIEFAAMIIDNAGLTFDCK